ncbi:hypothetical protein RSB1_gp05 [Ralstonia phage RSB1]|uniref:Uncharacterized protein n=1 Tax=Ralstonia phage RSB1 TaxID=551790 RepID=B5BTU1_9CAUD|nr:hypothetical protein RSB1_gp05 [Ralstonia phage RSB1]BAG70363.1 hypothetical protein [Ralstonia phage RSB1]
MSNDLIGFLRAWLDWAEAGAPDDGRHTQRNPNRFDRDVGLCSNTYEYEELALDRLDCDRGELEDELHDAFMAEGLDGTYPFGQDAYDDGQVMGAQHKCETRLAWVRSKLAAVNVAST